ncbi:hypothetical protein ACWDUL_12950 [Nocardia niigatensis]
MRDSRSDSSVHILTKGGYYLRRDHDGIDLTRYDEHGNPSGDTLTASSPAWSSSAPGMIASARPGPEGEIQYISSPALSTDKAGLRVPPSR